MVKILLRKNYDICTLLIINLFCHTQSRIFFPRIATFPQFQVYLNIIQNKMTSSLLLNNFYPVISHEWIQKMKKATNYCIRSGHSLWSAERLPAQGVEKEFLIIERWRNTPGIPAGWLIKCCRNILAYKFLMVTNEELINRLKVYHRA